MRLFSSLLAFPFLLLVQPAYGEPKRNQDTALLPNWLTIKGESRVRYESLDGQFRKDGAGSDQLLLFRSLFLVEADLGMASLGFELQDSRTYLGDDGTPLSNSITNPLDFLQAYVRFDDLQLKAIPGWSADLKLGRQTVSIGSKRHIERVDFANVIKSYTGAHLIARHQDGSEFHGLYVVPTARFPNDKTELFDNVLSGDEEQWQRHIWALHYRRKNVLGDIVPGLWGEVFIYGLEEKDSTAFPTPDRSYTEPGLRVYRKPAPGQWDIDLDVAYRFGTRYASSSASDTQSLDVKAPMAFLAAGYTFNTEWSPRLAFEYYYASGDRDPNDLSFDQHERLFGSRRSDLNNTSIHGPLTPANLSAPGFRIEVKPSDRMDARFYYHAAFLASETDQWVIAKLRDPTGQSGDFIGHTLDGRMRYWVIDDRLRLEVGASVFLPGEFAENAPGSPDYDRSLFGYTQLSLSF